MLDREKVIKELEWQINVFTSYCASDDRHLEAMKAALALLKEQEPVEPRRIDGKRNHFIKCGNCNYDLLTGYLFCPHCGRPIKWSLN